jgi:hypothetical protein
MINCLNDAQKGHHNVKTKKMKTDGQHYPEQNSSPHILIKSFGSASLFCRQITFDIQDHLVYTPAAGEQILLRLDSLRFGIVHGGR